MTQGGPAAVSLHAEANSLDDLLHDAYEYIIEHGHPVTSTKGDSIETIGATLVLEQPLNRLSRTESRYKYLTPLAELCWYLGGTNEAANIVPYIELYEDYVEEGLVYGGYGPRLFGQGVNAQVMNAISALRERSSSRRVVIQILDKEDMLPPRHEDIPCTCTIQFLVRDGAVHAVASMRSNDAWFGLVHDVFAFTMLQELVARDLGVEVGTYTHFAASLHLYDRHLQNARVFLDEGYQSTINPMDPMPQGSPWAGIEQLLKAEQSARANASIDTIDLPAEPYWADLARIMIAANVQRNGNAAEAQRIRGEILMEPIRSLLARSLVAGDK